MEGAGFCSYWNKHSEYEFAFPTWNASARTTMHGLIECFIHHRGIPHSIASDQETHFTAKEVLQQADAHGIHWIHNVSRCPEVTGLTGWWNGLLKTQLQ